MTQQTAVEWFYQKIRDSRDGFTFEELSEWRQQAKQMHKEQIVNAVSVGYDYCEDGKVRWMGEQYYNETYPKH